MSKKLWKLVFFALVVLGGTVRAAPLTDRNMPPIQASDDPKVGGHGCG